MLKKLYYIETLKNKYCTNLKMQSVGLIIIGNEILNGQVKDENIEFVTKLIPILGLNLKKISIISDDVKLISEEVSLFSTNYKYIITSGGIGPTHDDVTFEGVAHALNEPLHQHPELTELFKKFFNITPSTTIESDPRLKLALIPKSAKLKFGRDPITLTTVPFPVVYCGNIFILLGILSLFRKAFNIIKHNLLPNGQNLFIESVYFTKEESKITTKLNDVVKQFHNQVTFGSYPVLDNNYYKVKITLESTNNSYVQDAVTRLKNIIGQDNVSMYDPMTFTNAKDNIYGLSLQSNNELGTKVKESLDVIEEAFKRFKHSELILAFTGGKDCTVLLHMLYGYCQSRGLPMIKCLFMRTHPSFSEVEEFIKHSMRNYGVVPPSSNFIRYNGSIKESLWNLKTKDCPEIKAVFMGTRNNDPSGYREQKFSNTTEGWPEYCLINPVFNWTYSQIWSFLRQLSVPYCSLYDKGYTSLGGIDQTVPNSNLMYTDKNGQRRYYPAYKLNDCQWERAGRVCKGTTK